MQAQHWSTIASLLGFLGTICLFWPGWRVSRTMKVVSALRTHSAEPQASGDAGLANANCDTGVVDSADVATELVPILEQRAAQWRPFEHWLLIGGMSLIALSFATDLCLVKLA